MSASRDGGYEAGYAGSSCLWGTDPGSLVQEFLNAGGSGRADRLAVLDIGAGEGKNACALAACGAEVDAIECSRTAIANGIRAFPQSGVNWICEDVERIQLGAHRYDLVISYGLTHCLSSAGAAELLMCKTQLSLKPGGDYILAAFNDGPHDLSAHEGFSPLLLPHSWYVSAFKGWELLSCTDQVLHETHPHNQIPHYHSLTRVWARKPQ